MGQLLYGAGLTSIEIEDRVLAHLKLVITSKLRRSEPFSFSWHASDGAASSDRRITVWINPFVELQFHFSEDVPPLINRRWLEVLAESANSAGGLWLAPEPDADGQVDKSPFGHEEEPVNPVR
jgi:hypothetical protein